MLGKNLNIICIGQCSITMDKITDKHLKIYLFWLSVTGFTQHVAGWLHCFCPEVKWRTEGTATNRIFRGHISLTSSTFASPLFSSSLFNYESNNVLTHCWGQSPKDLINSLLVQIIVLPTEQTLCAKNSDTVHKAARATAKNLYSSQ